LLLTPCVLCLLLTPLYAVSAGRVEHSMRASMHILQGSFDPIMDANNNTDLLPLIIQAKVSAWGTNGCF
jgi:hypothetical protein